MSKKEQQKTLLKSEIVELNQHLGSDIFDYEEPMPLALGVNDELKEKVAFLDKQQKGRGREYYENLCMRAVNQSIGRAIRHRADYACILLVDTRYHGNSAVRAKLPGWIAERLELPPTFGHMFGVLSRFFREKRDIAKFSGNITSALGAAT